jgi:hypothetical protein
MGGGLMQLVAYGAQDVYLTGNPQITFFKVVYRRHTNFSMECIRQTVSGSLEEGKRATATIARNGDLVGQLYLRYKPSVTFSSGDTSSCALLCSNFGNALIRLAEVEIGGQLIDRHDGRFMQIYSDVTEENSSLNPLGFTKYQKMAGTGVNIKSITTSAASYNSLFGTEFGGGEAAESASSHNQSLNDDDGHWVPFQFWFCRNPGLALPLIALQYHEVKVTVELQEAEKLTDIALDTSDGTVTPSSVLKPNSQELWADYIYLDTDERRRFAQVSHEYLIEQVQIKKNNVPDGSGNQVSIDLNFNHPVKELLWVFTGDNSNNLKSGRFPGLPVDKVKDMFMTDGGTTSNSDDALFNSFVSTVGYDDIPTFNIDSKYHLTLNGQDRFEERDSFYFSNTQLYKHHTGSGSSYPVGSIMVYSFALKPEEHQPSGTCNFSRIDSSKLEISNLTLPTGSNSEINIYAINYNVLRIMSGMGGLAYSN